MTDIKIPQPQNFSDAEHANYHQRGTAVTEKLLDFCATCMRGANSKELAQLWLGNAAGIVEDTASYNAFIAASTLTCGALAGMRDLVGELEGTEAAEDMTYHANDLVDEMTGHVERLHADMLNSLVDVYIAYITYHASTLALRNELKADIIELHTVAVEHQPVAMKFVVNWDNIFRDVDAKHERELMGAAMEADASGTAH